MNYLHKKNVKDAVSLCSEWKLERGCVGSSQGASSIILYVL